MRSGLGRLRHARDVDVARTEYVTHRLASSDQMVGDDAPVASPPDSFRAHDGASLHLPCRTQSLHAGPKFVAQGVIRVVVKALIPPIAVHLARNMLLTSPQSAELRNSLVSDLN